MEQFHGTTIVSVRRGAKVALGGDGQVTLGNVVIKHGARKVRRLYHDRVLAGFAGGTADAFTLFERFEAKLEKHSGHLLRSAVELAKDWRTDRMLRRLEAMLAVADREHSLVITGKRRRARARARPDRDRQRRRLRAGRRARAAREHRARRRDDRAQVAGHRRRDLHLHQPEPHDRDAWLTRDASARASATEAAMTQMTPEEIVSELDKHIVGQEARQARGRDRTAQPLARQQVADPLRQEITPKNILMIGPTGVGKTEIARRLARLANAPFIKVEATKFTEVGYVGRDVDTIIRDLVELAIKQVREQETRRKVEQRALDAAEDRVLDALLPPPRNIGFGAAEGGEAADSATRQKFRKKLREGELDDKEIEIELSSAAPAHGADRPGRHGGDDAAAAGAVPGMPGRRKRAAS